MCMLEVVDLKKDYGTEPNITQALNGLSFKVAKGEFVGIMGASGSGKTTLLNCISTIDTPTGGQIYLDGSDPFQIKDRDLARFRRENLGFIFQDFNLLDTLTIQENIALALVINKENPARIDRNVQEIASKLGIQDVLGKFPHQVSGGQRQRCACARAIVNGPRLVLADEPTGALDSASSRVLMETMQEMNASLQATILMVTHDPFSASYASRILVLKDGTIYGELERGTQTRTQFFGQILATLEDLGGFSRCTPASV
jgi:putative ABC transport system ATP-binding protein